VGLFCFYPLALLDFEEEFLFFNIIELFLIIKCIK